VLFSSPCLDRVELQQLLLAGYRIKPYIQMNTMLYARLEMLLLEREPLHHSNSFFSGINMLITRQAN
jgi:hypothetical protein